MCLERAGNLSRELNLQMLLPNGKLEENNLQLVVLPTNSTVGPQTRLELRRGGFGATFCDFVGGQLDWKRQYD